MKPELIAFSEYKLGGVQNFYFNLLQYDSKNLFDKKWIFTRSTKDTDALPPQPFNICDEKVIYYAPERGAWRNGLKIVKLISAKEGLILANHPIELSTLHFFPRLQKTIFLLCHDVAYLKWAVEYSFLIDAFIAHNVQIYEDLKQLLPDRSQDIYFLPFGIHLSHVQRKQNWDRPLKIAFVARMHKLKGVFDIPKIDEALQKIGLDVEWTIIGDGPEKERFTQLVKGRKNFKIHTPLDSVALFEITSHCDIFLLPSSLDGTPVALLEAMSVGLVPIVYEFSTGIKKVVTDEVGYVVPLGAIQAVVNILMDLNKNRAKLESLSEQCVICAQDKYNVVDRSKDYFELFANYVQLKKQFSYPLAPKNRLDHVLIPFFVANMIRRLLKILKPSQS